jgi:hypothetical protein
LARGVKREDMNVGFLREQQILAEEKIEHFIEQLLGNSKAMINNFVKVFGHRNHEIIEKVGKSIMDRFTPM